MSDHWRTPRTRTLRSRLTIALVAGTLSTVVAAGALAQMSKSALIGKLEGPEVVTDLAKQPKTLNEAPQLAALVKAGKLPPVAERTGQDPLIISPSMRSANTAARGGAASQGRPTSGTATAAAPGPTTCCSGTTPGTR